MVLFVHASQRQVGPLLLSRLPTSVSHSTRSLCQFLHNVTCPNMSVLGSMLTTVSAVLGRCSSPTDSSCRSPTPSNNIYNHPYGGQITFSLPQFRILMHKASWMRYGRYVLGCIAVQHMLILCFPPNRFSTLLHSPCFFRTPSHNFSSTETVFASSR